MMQNGLQDVILHTLGQMKVVVEAFKINPKTKKAEDLPDQLRHCSSTSRKYLSQRHEVGEYSPNEQRSK